MLIVCLYLSMLCVLVAMEAVQRSPTGPLMVINGRPPSRFRQELRGVREVHADDEKGDPGRTEGGCKTVIRGSRSECRIGTSLSGGRRRAGFLWTAVPCAVLRQIMEGSRMTCGWRSRQISVPNPCLLGSAVTTRERNLLHTKLGEKTDDQRSWITIFGPRNCQGPCYIHKETTFCSAWDHHLRVRNHHG